MFGIVVAIQWDVLVFASKFVRIDSWLKRVVVVLLKSSLVVPAKYWKGFGEVF